MTDQLATSEYTSPNARSTAIVAGTSRGVFLVTEAGAEPVLESGGVRDLFQLDGRIFAGTGDGLRTSDDGGRSWSGTPTGRPRGVAGALRWIGSALRRYPACRSLP